MFKGVPQCIPTVSTLYFGLFSPFHYSTLPLDLPSSKENTVEEKLCMFRMHRAQHYMQMLDSFFPQSHLAFVKDIPPFNKPQTFTLSLQLST
jgi:hypothetical protein